MIRRTTNQLFGLKEIDLHLQVYKVQTTYKTTLNSIFFSMSSFTPQKYLSVAIFNQTLEFGNSSIQQFLSKSTYKFTDFSTNTFKYS